MASESPTPETIKQARKDAGLTQTQAAALVYSELRTWQHWEKGDRTMHPAFFELFTIKIALNNCRQRLIERLKESGESQSDQIERALRNYYKW